MEYREIGNTGERASIIGLGCEHLDGAPFEQVKDTIDAALENGVNLLDVFMPGQQVRENISKALRAGPDSGAYRLHGYQPAVRHQSRPADRQAVF